MAGELDSFRTTSEMTDVSIKSKDPDIIRRNRQFRNYGSVVSVGVQNSSTIKSKTLLKITQSALESKIPEANGVRRAVYRIPVGMFPIDSFTVSAYQMTSDWYEGGGQGTDSSYLSLGGCSWTHSKTPLGGRPSLPGSTPTEMNWLDTGYVSNVKQQGGCSVCWDFAVLAQLEAVHKKDVFEGTTTHNAENGTGADRTIAPIANDTGSTSAITGTAWKKYTLPVASIDQAYENGLGADWIFIADAGSGDIKINTTENTSNKPRLYINIVTRNDALSYEYPIQITSTSLFDSYINSGATSANYGTADTARVNSTMRYLLRADSLRAAIIAAVAADGSDASDTFLYATSAYCSLYTTKYTDATVKIYELLKVHFIEDQVTWANWKTSTAWKIGGAEGTNELDLSEQQVLNCVDGQDCNNGGELEDVFEYALTDSILGERFFNYTGGDLNCPDLDTMAEDVRVGWVYPWRFSSLDTLKKLISIQPIAVTHVLRISTPALVNYVWSTSDKCYYNPDTDVTNRHAQMIYGFDDNFTCDAGEGTGAWFMKNQYGTGRGKDGMYFMAYDNDLEWAFNTDNGQRVYTINYDSTATLWSTPGLAAGTDYASQPFTVKYVAGAASSWYEIEIPPALVNGWRNGNIPNYGIILTTNYSGSLEKSWESSESGSADKAYFEVYSAPITTQIGNTQIGNSSIGR